MHEKPERRKRRRRPTLTPRFNDSSIAYEIGLLRMVTFEQEKEKQEKVLKFPSKK